MTTFTEGNLQITFPDNMKARRFDDPETHGLAQMKAVDFIVEDGERARFIEFKDPDHPRARSENRQEFIESFHSGRLDEDLKYKYRDSFLYEWASSNTNKPISYWVLIGLEDLDAAALLQRTEELKRKLPRQGPASGVWKQQIVEECIVFNIETWNQYLPNFPVSRIPS